MARRMGRSASYPFVQTPGLERAQVTARTEEAEGEGLPQELSPHLERRRWSLLVRLARKRAAYFADIEDLLPAPDVDEALMEQPTRLNWTVEQPTRPVPGSLLVSAGEQSGGQKRGLLRCVGASTLVGLRLRLQPRQEAGRRLLSSSWPGAGE